MNKTMLLSSLIFAAVACSASVSHHPVHAAPGTSANPNNQDPNSLTSVSDAFRQHSPELSAPSALVAPAITKQVLTNGLALFSVVKSELPLVHISLVIRSGSASDPQNREGLAGFVGEMLKMGTKTRSATQIADAIETLGSRIDIMVGDDSIMLSSTVLRDKFDSMFEILTDLSQNAAFVPAEIERVRKLRLGRLEQISDQPDTLAYQIFGQTIYGKHPYAHLTIGDAASLKKISRKDLQAFYHSHFKPANAAIILVGDIGTTTSQQMVQEKLASWSNTGYVPTSLAVPKEQPSSTVLFHRPNAVQSQILVGELAVARDHKDYYPLVLCNAILGGLFNSRINMNLREEKGYTYGARSSFNFLRERGTFAVSTAVRTDATALALVEILKEITRMQQTAVTEEELKLAKQQNILALPGSFETVGNIAGMVANIYLYDLDINYYQNLPEHLQAVSISDIQRVANEHLHPENLSIVVVGDKNYILTGLNDLKRGKVVLREPSTAIEHIKSPKTL